MYFLNGVLLQIDEACNYIRDGRLGQLRIALLLLDNAAEVQMARCAEACLVHEAWQERLRGQVLEIPEQDRPHLLQDVALWVPLSKKKKHRIARYFDDKVRYLAERTRDLDCRLGACLSCLHKYRNEAYHHFKVRRETIETAAKLLLDINCELLLTLSGSSTTYDPSEDYSWLEERFGQAVSAPFHSQDLVLNAVSQFRTAAEMDDRSAARMLEDHLRSRIKDALDALDFVVKNTSCPDRQSAIRSSRGIAHPRRGDAGAPAGIPSCAGAENSHTVEFLDGLVDALSQITAATDRFESFRRFAMLESRFEGVEEDVQELAVAVDNMIQVQIDIARGK